MQKIGFLFVGLCIGTFSGCKSVVPYPNDWSRPQSMVDSELRANSVEVSSGSESGVFGIS